jgi:hypothetical protein
MYYEHKRLLSLAVTILTAVVAAGPTVAQAQRKSPGGLTGGDRLRPGSSYSNQRASRSIRHARDYSRDIYHYSRVPRTIQPSVAKADAEDLGRTITTAQQQLDTVRQEIGNDPAAATPLKTIDQHLATAEKQHKMLYEECCKESVDGLACMKHCNQILLELDKAQAEHDALIRSLEIKAQPTQ